MFLQNGHRSHEVEKRVKVIDFNALCAFVRQNGRLSKELDLVGHHVRTRLDELKRQEVSRLRMLLKAKLDSTNVQSEHNSFHLSPLLSDYFHPFPPESRLSFMIFHF